MASPFANMTSSSNFFDIVVFLLSSLVTGPSFMSISLVPELRQLLFMKDWTEVPISEIPSSGFCPISGHWGELWMPNLTRMSLVKSYWTLQNARVTACTISELLREKQLGGEGWGEGVKLPPPPRLRLSWWNPSFEYTLNDSMIKFLETWERYWISNYDAY